MWRIAALLAEGVGTSILPPPLSTDSPDDDVLAMLAGRAAAPFDDIRRDGYVASSPVFGWVRDRVLPGGRWRLAPAEFVEQLQRGAQQVPPAGLLVTSRRQLGRLNSQHPPPAGHSSDAPVAVVHPVVGERHGLAAGDPVVVSSPHGEMHTTVAFNAEVHPDSVSLPHGWFEANVSLLTSEHEVDDLTGMVLQTAVPVTVRLLRSPG